MSNRRKSGASAPIREPLLAVLDVEYARALKAKNLDRAAQITEIVERIKGLFEEPVALPPPAAPHQALETLPVQHYEPLGPAVEWTPPPPPQPDLPPVGGYQLQDLLGSIPEGVWGDTERREEAKGRVKDAVLRVTHEIMAMQMRYELALQAHNRNNRALELFEPEAIALGIAVTELAQRIINERRTAERRMAHVYAIMARVAVEIDQADAGLIEQLAAAGIREIQGVED